LSFPEPGARYFLQPFPAAVIHSFHAEEGHRFHATWLTAVPDG
jgi:hypothetical protein